MSQLILQLAEGRKGYRPSELLRGTAAWQLAQAPTTVEVRLCWFIQIQDISEVRRVQTLRYDRPAASERRTFEFQLPDAPYSYSGALALLGWAVELVALPEQEFTQVFFHLGPNGHPIGLHRQLKADESKLR